MPDPCLPVLLLVLSLGHWQRTICENVQPVRLVVFGRVMTHWVLLVVPAAKFASVPQPVVLMYV
jgi:hypothetical protein